MKVHLITNNLKRKKIMGLTERKILRIIMLPNLSDFAYVFHVFVLMKRYKQAKIRKRRNQKKIPTPKTEVGKNQTNNQVLIP